MIVASLSSLTKDIITKTARKVKHKMLLMLQAAVEEFLIDQQVRGKETLSMGVAFSPWFGVSFFKKQVKVSIKLIKN